MPNYCSNSVRFIGDEKAIEKVKTLFEDIQKKQAKTNRYHMPDIVQGPAGYMSDIDAGIDWINYETRWVPNLEVLEDIARHYDLEFIAIYAEPMAGLYGEAVFTNGQTQFVNIDTYSQKGHGSNPAFRELKEVQASMLLKQGPER